jgi:uncharacterized caspase-like protein
MGTGKAFWLRMCLRQALMALLACIALSFPDGLLAQERTLKGVALVIGQSDYAALPALPNPANDARLISGLLGELGFEVSTVLDADSARLARTLRRFAEDAEGSDVALLYYAGHGVEAGGENFLVPVDAAPDAPKGLAAISPVLASLQASVPVTILLLDACRTNPFPPGAMIAAEGGTPAPVSAAGLGALRGVVPFRAIGTASAETLGAVIGFAAEPGKAALDGDAGGASPYAAALAKHLPASGFAFGDVMTMVTEEVYLATRAQQLPWTNASLRRQLFFGLAPEETSGDEASIRGERRKLLLTIAATPRETRTLVEQVAVNNGVPMDALYGMLAVLGVDVTARSGNIAEQLNEGAGRLRQIIEQRDVQTRQDPEIIRLAALADKAETEGAIALALGFRERASLRADQIDASLDEAEASIETRRRELATTFENHAETAILNFDFETAARRYADAFEQIERYDVGRSYDLKVKEGDAWADFGDRGADIAALERAVDTYEEAQRIARAAPDAQLDLVVSGNNMAIALTQLGDRTMDPSWLRRAAEIYESNLKAQPREKSPDAWAGTQLNLGSVYQIFGERTGDRGSLDRAIRAFESAAEVFTRQTAPQDWAGLQMNVGNVHYALGNLTSDATEFEKSYKAIERTLDVWTRDADPDLWARAQSNLGGSLTAYGSATGDPGFIRRAIAAHEAAISAAPFDRSPATWAQAQGNVASAYLELGELTNDPSQFRRAVDAYRAVRQVYTAANDPQGFASTMYNEGRALLRVGRAENSVAVLREAVAALDTAAAGMVRTQAPIEWARIRSVTGEALKEIGLRGKDKQALRDARAAYDQARATFRDNGMGETGQGFWEKEIAAIDAELAKP